VDELDHRRVVGGLPQLDGLVTALLVGRLVDCGGQGARAARDRQDVLDRGHRAAQLEARGHLEVIEGKDVGRVGHGHEQLALGRK
jgi:hypothetical protein